MPRASKALSPDQLGRRSRLAPMSTGKRVTLQRRDIEWLSWLHRHGPLPSSFMLAATAQLGVSRKRATERLGDLFHEANTAHGGPYLMRPRQQFRTLDSRYQPLFYDLTSAGEAALRERKLWRERSRGVGGPWLHQLMVASITASIELAVNDRDDLEFIPQADILERAEATLQTEIAYDDPALKRRVVKAFAPDAVFGLKYITKDGPRYRFFVVEADRGTEPLVSNSGSRKSMLRSFHQYGAYIGEKLYRAHLGLTAPLLLLTVTTSEQRLANMLEVASEVPALSRAALFQSWESFRTPFRVPDLKPTLLGGPWQRVAGPFVVDQL